MKGYVEYSIFIAPEDSQMPYISTNGNGYTDYICLTDQIHIVIA